MAQSLSEYEKRRLQRVKENEALLKTLGLDLKTRRADYGTPSTRTSKRRRRTNSDDDDDWIPGVEEAPRRSRRAKKQVSYDMKKLFKVDTVPSNTKATLKNVTKDVVKRIEYVMDTGVVRTRGKGKRVKQLEDDFTVPDGELPPYFDDSNDPEVFYGFSDSECELDPQDEERAYHWQLDSDMEQYFDSASDESTFEGFDMNESFLELYEEVKRISQSNKQPKRDQAGGKSYEEEELSDDDEYLYCEECGQINRGDCPVHGPLIPLDEEDGRDEDSKQFTTVFVPKQLTVKPSTIPNAGLGLFAKEFLPNGVRCGPYIGTEVPKEEVGSGVDTAYMWEVKKAGQRAYFIDGKDESTSNWLRYVNCARTESEQNMVAFQYRGCIYYRSFRNIHPGDELLVWYGEEYAKDLGIDVKLPNGEDSSEDEESGVSTRHGFVISYKCLGCGSSFVEHSSFKIHLRNNRACNDANPQLFTCGKCGVTFGRLHELQYHIRQHQYSALPATTSERWSKNSILTGAREMQLPPNEELGNLKSHLRKSDCKPYKCDYCDKAFTHDSTLKTHLRIHTGDKPYKCTYCDKAFNQDIHLKKHLRIHTGDKPYKCTHCDKVFNRDDTLKTHLRIHTGDKPYKCTYCDKAFNNNSDLKKHLRIHTGDKPYKCTYCDKAFNQDSNLKTHLRIHTGDKPYKCTYCDKAFNQDSHLKTHLRIHTGDKPYKCTYCDKAFKNRNSFNLHIKGHVIS